MSIQAWWSKQTLAANQWASKRWNPLVLSFGIFSIVSLSICLVTYRLGKQTQDELDSFLISLSASSIEDVIFFLIVGVIIHLVSLNNPSEARFDSRINFLLNSKFNSEEAKEHIKFDIKDRCIYSPEYSAIFEYSDVESSLGAIKLTVQVDRNFLNMLGDVSNSLRGFPIRLFADDFGEKNSTIVRGQLLNVLVSISGKTTYSPTISTIDIDKVTGTAEDKFDIEIPPNAETRLSHKFWVWHKIGSPYDFECQRYTQNTKLIVRNRSKSILTFDWIDNSPITLSPGLEKAIDLPSLQPQRLRLFVLKSIG